MSATKTTSVVFDRALEAVSSAWGIDGETIKAGNGIQAQLARKVAVSLIRENGEFSWNRIARWFGVANQTVSSHQGRMGAVLAARPDIAQKIRRAEYLFSKATEPADACAETGRHAIFTTDVEHPDVLPSHERATAKQTRIETGVSAARIRSIQTSHSNYEERVRNTIEKIKALKFEHGPIVVQDAIARLEARG